MLTQQEQPLQSAQEHLLQVQGFMMTVSVDGSELLGLSEAYDCQYWFVREAWTNLASSGRVCLFKDFPRPNTLLIRSTSLLNAETLRAHCSCTSAHLERGCRKVTTRGLPALTGVGQTLAGRRPRLDGCAAQAGKQDSSRRWIVSCRNQSQTASGVEVWLLSVLHRTSPTSLGLYLPSPLQPQAIA